MTGMVDSGETQVHYASSGAPMPTSTRNIETGEWKPLPIYDDPELWKAGEVKPIPTIDGRRYPCRITRVLPAVIEFDGPTGPACITRSLYTTLTKGEQ